MVALAELEKQISDSLIRIDSIVVSEHASLKASVRSMLRDLQSHLDIGADLIFDDPPEAWARAASPSAYKSIEPWGKTPSPPGSRPHPPEIADYLEKAHPLVPASASPVLPVRQSPGSPGIRASRIGSPTDAVPGIRASRMFGPSDKVSMFRAQAETRRRLSIASSSSTMSLAAVPNEQVVKLEALAEVNEESEKQTLEEQECKERKTRRPSKISVSSEKSEDSIVFSMRQQFSVDTEKEKTSRKLLKKKSTKQIGKGKSITDDHDESLEAGGSRCAPVHPDSFFSRLWDTLACLCVLHDFIMMPLQVFNDADSSRPASELAVSFYWAVNIPAKFFIGYLNNHGRAVTSFRPVAKHYVKSWFGFDVSLVVIDLTSLLLENGESFRLLLALRLLRMLRLARIFEMLVLLRCWIELHVRSEGVSITFGIMKIIVAMIGIAHLFTCCWYFAGTMDANANWLKYLNLENESVYVQYVYALHWAIVQYSGDSSIAPQNGTERAYASGIQFVAFITAAVMVSDLTTLMTQLHLVGAQSQRQILVLQRYLFDKKVATRLANRIIDNARLNMQERKRKPPDHTVELLNQISAPLLTELHYHLNADSLKVHPFFFRYDTHNKAATKGICHLAVRMDLVAPSDVIYEFGEVMHDPCMYFIDTGRLCYSINDGLQDVAEGACINEPVLWLCDWMQLGTLETKTATHVVSVIVNTAVEVMQQFRTEHFYPGQYARLFSKAIADTQVHDLTDIASDFVNVKHIVNNVFGKDPKTLFSTAAIAGMVRSKIVMPVVPTDEGTE
eukprot:TRINITY_DN93889_c0_g1_i1.p1 TRINITY_DN93889_c0_g1~~TRINITY_DN93889_c0_g1_i1.p1  ORF type:complete len:788 (-),score=125.72 TRINITY_DN93889_c0_g1_i1:60-2423(-)